MKKSKLITISIIILSIIFSVIFIKFAIAGKSNKSEKALIEKDILSDIENAIIIKGIESDSEHAPEGPIIYNNSIIDDLSFKYKKKSSDKKIKVKNKKEDILALLKKQDARWHLTSHKIVKGENLWSIAKKFDTDYKTIIVANGINKPDLLNPGKTILVPNKNGLNYKVVKNDSLCKIAKKYCINKRLIAAQNNLKKDIIKENEFLFLPDAVAAPEKILVHSKKNKTEPNDFYPEKSNSETVESKDEYAIDNSPADEKSEIKNKHQVFTWPLKGKVTSAFGKRINPIDNKSKFHCGLDIGTDIGAPVKASADGEAIFCGWKKGYGRVVILKHADGYITVYAHNKENILKSGEKVQQGQIIALSGISGAVTGPHLHFEIRKYLTPLNPYRFLNR
ncbi:MAG: M23 family metallopeptidase [Spirochaetota bacterium]